MIAFVSLLLFCVTYYFPLTDGLEWSYFCTLSENPICLSLFPLVYPKHEFFQNTFDFTLCVQPQKHLNQEGCQKRNKDSKLTFLGVPSRTWYPWASGVVGLQGPQAFVWSSWCCVGEHGTCTASPRGVCAVGVADLMVMECEQVFYWGYLSSQVKAILLICSTLGISSVCKTWVWSSHQLGSWKM